MFIIPPNAPSWAREISHAPGMRPITLRQDAYPSREARIVFPHATKTGATGVVACDVTESPASVAELLLMARSMNGLGARYLTLVAPWIAYGRQDRMTTDGDLPLGIALGDLVSHVFDKIITLDAHSDAFIRSFHGRLRNVIPWEHPEIAEITPRGITLIIAPDHGATRRARALSRITKIPFIVLDKKRTSSGTRASLSKKTSRIQCAKALIIDDMVDRGSTLIGAAKLLRQHGATKVHAIVTHGIAGSPILAIRPRELDSLTVLHDHRTGKLHPVAKQLIFSILDR